VEASSYLAEREDGVRAEGGRLAESEGPVCATTVGSAECIVALRVARVCIAEHEGAVREAYACRKACPRLPVSHAGGEYTIPALAPGASDQHRIPGVRRRSGSWTGTVRR